MTSADRINDLILEDVRVLSTMNIAYSKFRSTDSSEFFHFQYCTTKSLPYTDNVFPANLYILRLPNTLRRHYQENNQALTCATRNRVYQFPRDAWVVVGRSINTKTPGHTSMPLFTSEKRIKEKMAKRHTSAQGPTVGESGNTYGIPAAYNVEKKPPIVALGPT